MFRTNYTGVSVNCLFAKDLGADTRCNNGSDRRHCCSRIIPRCLAGRSIVHIHHIASFFDCFTMFSLSRAYACNALDARIHCNQLYRRITKQNKTSIFALHELDWRRRCTGGRFESRAVQRLVRGEWRRQHAYRLALLQRHERHVRVRVHRYKYILLLRAMNVALM